MPRLLLSAFCLLLTACATLLPREVSAPQVIDQRVIAGAAAQYTQDWEATHAARTATQIPVDQTATAVREQWTAQAVAYTQAADSTQAAIYAVHMAATVNALTPTITRTPTASHTPTITHTPDATQTVYVKTSAALIWANRVDESTKHKESAERGAQAANIGVGSLLIIVFTIFTSLLFLGWRWVAYTKDDLAEREHRRTLAQREHAARLGAAQVERTKTEIAQGAAEERRVSLEHENFLHWRDNLRRFLSWVKALPNAATSRPRMEDLQITTRDNWNKCTRVLQQLGALSITPNGPNTERRVLIEPREFERKLAPQTLTAALEAVGEKLEFPPTVAAFDNARAREITENFQRAAAQTTPPLSEGQSESVSAS